ncbi:MAG: isoprenylcysteine carboxylmethyltransferase family protein [Chloroflexi bacterium]|nr:isoprenylcysteine carboxylmethyltransferase family protein [Chloroflexota bacterium]
MPFKPPAAYLILFKITGLVLFIAGIIFTLWARQTLGRMWGISTSREVKLLPDHQLVDQGPYALVRHPMYLGWWIALLGMTLIYWTWIVLIMFVFSLYVFYQRAQREEAVLADHFGERWQAYVQRSKFLIPWIY